MKIPSKNAIMFYGTFICAAIYLSVFIKNINEPKEDPFKSGRVKELKEFDGSPCGRPSYKSNLDSLDKIDSIYSYLL